MQFEHKAMKFKSSFVPQNLYLVNQLHCFCTDIHFVISHSFSPTCMPAKMLGVLLVKLWQGEHIMKSSVNICEMNKLFHKWIIRFSRKLLVCKHIPFAQACLQSSPQWAEAFYVNTHENKNISALTKSPYKMTSKLAFVLIST